MRILFCHPNFPAQFPHIAFFLASNPANQVFFATKCKEQNIPGVHRIIFSESRESSQTHSYLRHVESAVLQGQAVYRAGMQLKAQGFEPDVVFGHSGWGSTLFIKDIFPQTALLCYFEWFNHAYGVDRDFDPADTVTADTACSLRVANAPILMDLATCDAGVSPTYWQQSQFPIEYRQKIQVIHDGVPTDIHCPLPGAKLVLPEKNIDLSEVDEVITYVARGKDNYRGFPQFMEAAALLQQRRPHCHIVVVGNDHIAYGEPLPSDKSLKDIMLEKLELDLSRIHFTGLLPRLQYLQVLQASSVHVYLTRPYILSWSMLEAMSTGCMLVASNTPPVREVVEDGVNGLLVDYFSPACIADRVEEALDNKEKSALMRARARETILEKYDVRKIVPLQAALLEKLI